MLASVQNLWSSLLLSKNIKIRIYNTIILSVVLYGYEIWSLTLREEHVLRMFENGVLRRIFGLKRGEVTGEWRKLHNEELHDLYPSASVIRMIKLRRMRWRGHAGRERFWWESQQEEDHQEEQDAGGWIILKLILEKQNGVVWTRLIWLRIGTSGRLL
jgi:hypothetical protein